MTTESKIIEICKAAMDEAEEQGQNWADYVDAGLEEAGVPSNQQLARKLTQSGHYDIVAVIDGEYFDDNSPAVISRGDNGVWAMDDISVYQPRRRICED
jgi:hypothetical protein